MRGIVVFYPCKAGCNLRSHESAAQLALARKLAAIKDCDFAEQFDASRRYAGPLYFVPSHTLLDIRSAHELGIHHEHHLFGGVVPFPFVATKVITHPLLDENARAPAGWSHQFARHAHDAVLPGFSVFTLDDARRAGRRLLEQGAVRIKKADGIGGLGQSVAASPDQLEAELASCEAETLLREGIVIERNLNDVVTHSVGQVRVGHLLASYHGRQRLTVNNRGEEVYGGSDLVIVRGDFDALLELGMSREVRIAIAQARAYHAAAFASYPDMFASRCNYDVAQGMDDAGQWRSGVLEQSWRIGGASGAEVAALAAFQADPALGAVCASTTEVYGTGAAPPADAVIYFQGIDEHVGPITKYSRIKPYADS
jgi:hypothetical protein